MGEEQEIVDAPPAIPSGTVAILRDGDLGLEVLMVRRPPSERDTFSGLWVFPGGKVDAEDSAKDSTELGSALHAAVRETREEVAIELDALSLVPLNRWEPKPVKALARRFSAWVFLAPATGSEVQIDGVEIHDHDWMDPAAAMTRHQSGDIGLSPPTWHTLFELSRHRNVDSVLDWARSHEPEYYFSLFGQDEGHTFIAWHGDFLAGGNESDRHRLWLLDGAWRYERNV